MPSALDKIFIENSLEDLLFRIELKYSYQQAMVWQDYQNLVLVAHAIFGKQEEEAEAVQPVSIEDAQRKLMKVLGKSG